MGARMVLASGVRPSGRPPSLAPTFTQPLSPDGRSPWPPGRKVSWCWGSSVAPQHPHHQDE